MLSVRCISMAWWSFGGVHRRLVFAEYISSIVYVLGTCVHFVRCWLLVDQGDGPTGESTAVRCQLEL